MYAGSYLEENIGHEVINLFKDDEGSNYIYVNKDGTSITDDTLKIRVYQINHWNSKNVLVIRKVAPLINGSKEDKVLLREEFDTVEEAKEYVNDNLLNEYEYAFKLQKSGNQYGNDDLDLWKEDVINLGISVEEAGTLCTERCALAE